MSDISKLENEIVKLNEAVKELEEWCVDYIEAGWPEDIITELKSDINKLKRQIKLFDKHVSFIKKYPEFANPIEKEIEPKEITVDERTQKERDQEKEQLKRLMGDSKERTIS